MTDAEIAGYMDWRGPGAYTERQLVRIRRIVEEVRRREREAMMQLFTDPENQPTQHGTVTVEYMQREIAAERERIKAANAPEIERCNAHIKALEDELKDLRERLAQPKAMQVRPSEFVQLVKGQETLTGFPAYWAEWPDRGQA